MVSELVSSHSDKKNTELKWNHIARPDVIRREIVLLLEVRDLEWLCDKRVLGVSLCVVMEIEANQECKYIGLN
jgi:hypothetical protein